jgi:nucleolar complex protein 3
MGALQQTETLKLLFVLYFRILKNDRPTPLLSAALRGISRYAHQVNVDFFRDLMAVLKGHIAGTHWKALEDADDRSKHLDIDDVRTRLECIVTAFELLTGQGTYQCSSGYHLH